jgi:hypothetical protein
MGQVGIPAISSLQREKSPQANSRPTVKRKSNSGTENLSEKQQEKSEEADPRGSDTGRSNREA